MTELSSVLDAEEVLDKGRCNLVDSRGKCLYGEYCDRSIGRKHMCSYVRLARKTIEIAEEYAGKR